MKENLDEMKIKKIVFEGDLTEDDIQTIQDFFNAPWGNADGTTTPKEGNTWVIAHNDGVIEREIGGE